MVFSVKLFVLTLAGITAISESKTVYKYGDPVEILKPSKFKQSSSGWNIQLVEFYKNWCGDCINYAVQFRKFVTETYGWKAVMQISSMDCAKEENLIPCRDYDIDEVPTLKLFGKMQNSDEVITKSLNEQSPKKLQETIIQFINDVKQKWGDSGSPIDLSPCRVTHLKNLWKSVSQNVKAIFVINEPEASFVGSEMMLDVSGINSTKIVRLTNSTDQVTLFELKKNSSLQLLANASVNSNARQQFKEILEEKGVVFPKPPFIPPPYTTPPPLPVVYDQAHIYLDDIEIGLQKTIQFEIAMKKVYTEHELSAAKNFIRVIYKYIKLPDRITNYLKRIYDLLNNVKAPISGDDYLKIVKKAQTKDAYLRKGLTYKGCLGSEPHFRGYPCTLWTTFHLLIVQAYTAHLNDLIENPREILLTIRNYVVTFFSCHSCRQHFEKLSREINSTVNNPEDSVLWLWQGHNKVNKRIKGSYSDDPVHPKIQYPTQKVCPQCHTGDKFNQKEVFKFLERHYNLNNIIA